MDTYRQVMRYLSCESRKPAVAASQKIIDMDGLYSVEVRPIFIFRGYRNFEAGGVQWEKTSENNCAGTLSGSCKDMLQSSGCITDRKNKDTGAKQNLELYSMLRYGRILLSEDDAHINVGASFYFLRKNQILLQKKNLNQTFFRPKVAETLLPCGKHIMFPIRGFFSGCTGEWTNCLCRS